MYCRNSITLHLIKGLGAVMLIISVFLFQLSLITKLCFILGAFFCCKVVLLVGSSA